MDGSETTTLSIITVNLNNKNGLEKTLLSVRSQTYKNYEHIIIDGGSIDGSKELIEKYVDSITYWVSEKDNGIYNAMNKGISKAKGTYCLFLNSGDFLIDASTLEQVFSLQPDAAIIYGNMMIDYGHGNTVLGKQPEKITFEFMMEATLWHPVSFIKNELLIKSNGYNEQYKIVSDYDFFIRTIIVENVTTQFIPVTVACFNTQGIGSSAQHEQLHLKERKDVIDRYFPSQVVASALRLNKLKQSPWLVFVERIKPHRILKFVFLNLYRIVNKIMNLLHW